MAINQKLQSTTNHFLTPFTIASDCPQVNREIIHRIIIYLKNIIFKETKHIQQINIHRNHLTYYLPVILLDRDQFNKHYIYSPSRMKKEIKNHFIIFKMKHHYLICLKHS